MLKVLSTLARSNAGEEATYYAFAGVLAPTVVPTMPWAWFPAAKAPEGVICTSCCYTRMSALLNISCLTFIHSRWCSHRFRPRKATACRL